MRKDNITTSDPNFEEKVKLGITPDESFGKISQPDKMNHKCLGSENGPDKTNHKCLDSETGMTVKTYNCVSNLLRDNEHKLKERNRALWSLMATNMDADDPEKYCRKLREIDAQLLELTETIHTLKAELAGINKEVCNVDLPVVDDFSYNPPDIGKKPSSNIRDIRELREELNSPEVDCHHIRGPIGETSADVRVDKY